MVAPFDESIGREEKLLDSVRQRCERCVDRGCERCVDRGCERCVDRG